MTLFVFWWNLIGGLANIAIAHSLNSPINAAVGIGNFVIVGLLLHVLIDERA